jgi:hypothetical protein
MKQIEIKTDINILASANIKNKDEIIEVVNRLMNEYKNGFMWGNDYLFEFINIDPFHKITVEMIINIKYKRDIDSNDRYKNIKLNQVKISYAVRNSIYNEYSIIDTIILTHDNIFDYGY